MRLNLQINKIQFTLDDWDKISIVLENAYHLGQFLYPTRASTYDEDAGVFTDYGQNDPNRTWAQIHFRTLLQHAIVECKPINDNAVDVFVLYDSIPAIIQSLVTIGSAWRQMESNQRYKNLINAIYRGRAESLWESDGHYGPESHNDFVESFMKKWALSRSEYKKFAEQFEDSKKFTTLKQIMRDKTDGAI